MLKLWKNTIKVNAPAEGVRGWFRANGQLISGWAIDGSEPGRKVDVDVFVDGTKVGSCRADRFDQLVQSKEGGDGLCAFAFYHHDPEGSWTDAQVTARDARSGTELRTKLPTLTRAEDVSAPLSIEAVALPRVRGRIGAYPAKAIALEIWSANKRIASDIPITLVDKKSGAFTALLPEEVISTIVSGPVEVALPGLKEAGLAVAVNYEPSEVHVQLVNDELSVHLPEEYDDSRPLSLTVVLTAKGSLPAELQATAINRLARVKWPADLPRRDASIEVVIDGISLPTHLRRIRDVEFSDHRFESAGQKDSAWLLSADTDAERSFFAFPAPLAEHYRLSGHILRLKGPAEAAPISLAQTFDDELNPGDRIRTVAMVRSPKPSQFVLRLSDSAGSVSETFRATDGENVWFPLELNFELSRALEGALRFEVECSSDEFEVGLSDAGSTNQETITESVNILTNGTFERWPHGTGEQQHSMKGELCEGWRVMNWKCATPVLSRAVMDEMDGSFGLAVAAPEISDRLWIQADLDGQQIGSGPLELKFRAGVPSAARRMLSQGNAGVPEFAQIFRIMLVRRGHLVTKDGYGLKEQIGSVITKKVPVAWEMGDYSFLIPTPVWPAPEQPVAFSKEKPVGASETTYHLVFEFRAPVTIALHDVAVLPFSAKSTRARRPSLRLEDRNIELQVSTTKAIEQWISPAVSRAVKSTPAASTEPLKWSAGTFGEPVEIIIPVFNALDETLGCLNALSGSTSVPILIRLIDDGSDAHVLTALEDYARDKPWVTVHSFGGNRGYTYAADFGIRNARSTWVVLLNSDTVVTTGWLEGMLQCARSDPSIAFVGPLSNAATYQSVPDLYDRNGKWKINSLPRNVTPEDMASIVRSVSAKDYPEAPLLNGFCTLMKRSVFMEIGGLNYGAFPVGYGEENDLCIRARKAGARLAIADDVYVFHHKSASFGSERRQELSKKGSDALKELHPDVDVSELTRWFRDIPSLASIRAGVTAGLATLESGVGGRKNQPALSSPTRNGDETSVAA